jgi:1-acyl-sn-glycerol-3-phosphate acyltransferase
MNDWKYQPARDLGLPTTERLQSLQRESGLMQTAGHLAWWNLVGWYLSWCHNLRIHGRERLPTQPPFVMVANHASHLDVLTLAAPLPWRLRDRVFPVAAGDTFFHKPWVAAFAAGTLNALPIWRGHTGTQAIRQLRQRLVEEPCGYILFPEGTRSRDGTMTRFKPGLGMLVAETDVPVIPCHIEGAHKCLPPHRLVPRFRPITVRVGEPLRFGSLTNDRAGWTQIADQAEAAVRGLMS